jgi:hypothetical protein
LIRSSKASTRASCRSCSPSTAGYSLPGLQKNLHACSISAENKLCQREIEATDEEIDALVYELYGLTEEEIAVVEARDH